MNTQSQVITRPLIWFGDTNGVHDSVYKKDFIENNFSRIEKQLVNSVVYINRDSRFYYDGMLLDSAGVVKGIHIEDNRLDFDFVTLENIEKGIILKSLCELNAKLKFIPICRNLFDDNEDFQDAYFLGVQVNI